MEGSSFDVPRIESSQQLTATPALDMQRAKSSWQHVRALNTQFASWVQAQLKNHPDELWEDGVRDYLAHASDIMEKFSDVVNWLKANAAKGGSLSGAEFQTTENKMMPEMKNSGINLSQDKVGFTPSGTQSSVTATLSSIPANHDAPDDADENELEQPSSPSVKKSEEKGIIVVHEVKCKLYVKSSDPADKDAWKDRGMGQLYIKCKEGLDKGTKESKPTIIVRNDVGKLLLNALLYPGIKTNLRKNSLAAIFHTSGDNDGNDGGNPSVVARTFLFRTKTEEDRNKLATAIKEYAPAS